ncbi:TetR/AcrR family transcriptional regulator [Paraburkholderia sp. ZP32-5]|uniref:TetR/AcrR family transcriptional regulator n=1 Tax=Paraburkholderia sp. ZP32-5 TaxID=2883245 RepID=UPI001F1BE09D|nr:TetR/AcrR family transcriptional regulator [Paraburkholderia sp. ZP32-5]
MARARGFDIDEAIRTATNMFWRQGYERTSLADLTAAMGITPPSFYFAFGNKEGLFRQVLKYYVETRLASAEQALDEPTARGVAESLLHRLLDLYTDETCPPGCLVVNSTLSRTDETASIRAELAASRNERRKRLSARFQKAKDDGDLPPEADPDELARYLMVVGWGLAFAAQAGMTREELRGTIALALDSWPR